MKHPLDAPSPAPVADLDAATVVAIAQALSTALALPVLAERVVGVALEVSGAARGTLTSGQRPREVADDGSTLVLPVGEHGVLRLEGAPGTFTPRRLALVEIVAAQAALALENARLRADLRAAEDRVRDCRLMLDTVPVMCWSTRPDGWTEYLNRPWLEYTGMTLEQACRGWASAIHPDDAPRVSEIWASILASGASGEVEARLRRHDGVYRWFLFRAQAIRDDAGRIIRWYGSNTDIEDLKRAEAALRRSEDFLNEAQRMSHTGSFTWDPPTGAIGWSEETCRIYEVDPRSDPVLSIVVGRTHPDDRARTRAFLDRAARDGLDWEDERRLVMPDGRLKHVHVIAHAIRDATGRVTFAGAVKDITTAKLEEQRLQAALADKEALLKEVHHRVKNNLQLVCSMLSLEAARSTNVDVVARLTESRNRVRSMALVHENLYRAGDFGRVPMARHVVNLCEHLGRAHGSDDRRVAVTAVSSELHLEMDRAIACGLIINELVSNAFKHAFPGGRSGRVSVALAAEGADRCMLTVGDDGVGLPAGLDVAQVDSLGLQLVHDLADQLGGEIVVSRDAGTTFTIAFDARARELTP